MQDEIINILQMWGEKIVKTKKDYAVSKKGKMKLMISCRENSHRR